MCIDWEAMILDRQEQIEHLLDQCDGECERCAYSEQTRLSQELNGEWLYRCTLTDEIN